VSYIFVGIVQTIIIAVADVNPRYAISIVTREQVAETRTALRLAVLRWFIRPVTAVVVTVAIPRGRYTSVVGTTEAVCWASSLRAMHRVLVTIIATIVVTIAQPVRFHTYVRLLALQMVGRARYILRAPVMGFVRSRVVLAVVYAIAHLKIENNFTFLTICLVVQQFSIKRNYDIILNENL